MRRVLPASLLALSLACGGPAPEEVAYKLVTTGKSHAELAAEFRDPPPSVSPLTWWHWMNGNISKAGITADLEAMKQIGLRGAVVFSVAQDTPAGDSEVILDFILNYDPNENFSSYVNIDYISTENSVAGSIGDVDGYGISAAGRMAVLAHSSQSFNGVAAR